MLEYIVHMENSIKNLRLFEDFISEKEKTEKKNDDYLFFNGNKLDFIVGGKVEKSWKAVSGRTQYHWYVNPDNWMKRYKIPSNEWAKTKNEGPTPPGNYTLGATQSRKIADDWKNNPDFVKKVVTRSVVSNLPGSRIKDEQNHEFSDNTDSSRVAWGSHRWRLNPKKGTDTFGRTSFYLHGGSTPGSIGCIDLVTDSPDFGEYYIKWLKKTGRSTIDVKVDYSTFNKNTSVDIDSQPYKMKGINLQGTDSIPDWYDKTNIEMADSIKKSRSELSVNPDILKKRQPGKSKIHPFVYGEFLKKIINL